MTILVLKIVQIFQSFLPNMFIPSLTQYYYSTLFVYYTALKMDDIKKAPCGQAPLCSSESNMSNHVRMSFVLLITVANQKIWALEIFGFSGVRKWYKNVCKTAIFQAKRLIFCVNTYFLILSTPINSVLWFLKKKIWLIHHLKSTNSKKIFTVTSRSHNFLPIWDFFNFLTENESFERKKNMIVK